MNKILRGLLVLIIAAALTFGIWVFASGVYLLPSIAAAIIVVFLIAFILFRSPKNKVKSSNKNTNDSDDELVYDEYLDSNSEGIISESLNNNPITIPSTSSSSKPGSTYAFRSTSPRPDAKDVATKYFRMAQIASQKEKESSEWKYKPAEIEKEIVADLDDTQQEDALPPEETSADADLQLIVDKSIISEDDKIQIENAVWYTCENPYCKYTHFLDVHHIIDEADGGSNKLDNLIVLCPYCHNLAHKGEIPEKELRSWISDRAKRLKFKLDWRY